MKLKCPGCATVLSVPDSAAGKVVKCPCGKQIRAPGGAPAAAVQPPSAPQQRPAAPAQRQAAPQPQARRPPAAPGGGLDPTMFDELTDQDLQPVAAVSQPGQKHVEAAPTGTTAKLLNEHAKTAGGASNTSFRVGPKASPWVRLGAAILDGFIISFISMPIMILAVMFLLPALGMSLQGLEGMSEDEAAAAAAGSLMAFLMAMLVACAVAYLLPIIIYAIMVTKSGQTFGKKICGIRIVDATTHQLPGFVNGVLVRAWAIVFIGAIPAVGPIFSLVNLLMIFGEDRQCLHDKFAGTIVVET